VNNDETLRLRTIKQPGKLILNQSEEQTILSDSFQGTSIIPHIQQAVNTENTKEDMNYTVSGNNKNSAIKNKSNAKSSTLEATKVLPERTKILPREKQQKEQSIYEFTAEILETLVLTAIIFFAVYFSIQNFQVIGTSMEPTLHNQEFIWVDKLSYRLHAPQRGDIVVFIAPPNPSENYVKRIIGVPGDVITVNGTKVTVDGVLLQEPYVAPQDQGNPFRSEFNIVVPPDKYFVLGDNRAVSDDSRDWGFLPKQNIIGRGLFVYWPPSINNFGFVHDYSSVFANVHQ
jgi:signal peptidase I